MLKSAEEAYRYGRMQMPMDTHHPNPGSLPSIVPGQESASPGAMPHWEQNERLLSSDTLKGILGEVLHCILEFTKAAKGNIQLVSTEDQAVSLAVHQGHGEAFIRFFERGGSPDITRATFAVQQLMVLEDVEKGALLQATPDLKVILGDGIRALATVPLIGRAGRMYGRLTLCYTAVYQPGEAELKRMELLSRIVVNLIERMFVEQALRDSEAHFAAVFSAAEVGLSELTLDGRYRKVNDTLCRILGREREDILRRTFQEVTYKEDLAASAAAVRRLVETGKPVSMDKRYQRADGSLVWVSSKLSLLHPKSGEAPMMLAVTVDLTRRMLAEKALRESELRIRKLFEQAPGFLIILAGPSHMLEFVNKAFVRLTGDKRRVTGMTLGQAFPGIGGDGFGGEIDTVYRTGQSFTAFEKRLDFRTASRGPEVTRYVDYVCQPISDAAGKVTGVFVEGFDVTDRVQGREALRASERLYTTLFNKIDEGFCILKKVDPEEGRPADFRFTAANPAMSQITAREQIKGLTIAEAFPEEPRDWFDIFHGVAESGKPIRFERALTTGTMLELYAFPLQDEEQQLGVIFQDITARKKAEQALREREEQQAFLLKLSDALQPMHPPGRLRQAAVRQLALHYGAVRAYYAEIDPGTGRPGSVTSYPERKPAFAGDTFREAGAVSVPRVVDAGAGETAWLEVPLSRQNHVAAVIGLECPGPRSWKQGEIDLLQEAAARIQVCVEQARAEQALQESEERFRAIVSQTAAGIWMADREGRLIFTNRKFEQMLGYGTGELAGVGVATLLAAGDQAPFEKDYTGMMTGRGALESEGLLVRKDGSAFWSRLSLAPLGGTRGEPQAAVAVVLDISERKALEKSKDEFIAVASHELKTPVTSIKGYVELLRQALVETGDETGALLAGKLDGQVDRLIALIRDLLDTSKIAEGQLSLKPKRFDLNGLIQERVSDLQRTTSIHRIVFTPGALEPVEADWERIGQVLNNLLANAIRYSPDGGEITVETTDTGSGICISVHDQGVGIPIGVRDKLFDRFFRVNRRGSATFPGMGLGLYISQEILKRHGGSITLEENEGEGTTFLVHLPYRLNA